MHDLWGRTRAPLTVPQKVAVKGWKWVVEWAAWKAGLMVALMVGKRAA